MGDLSPIIEDEWPFWRIVIDGKRDISEVRQMDLEEIDKYNSILTMRSDYDTAFHNYYEKTAEAK